jgi:isopentenyldiphosphate isomerase
MQQEMLTIFDQSMVPQGVCSRAEVHQQGYWHETFHCWFVQATPHPSLFLQLRSPQKDAFPNTLDVTAAGHLLATETPRDGVREIVEEIGIAVVFENLYAVGIQVEEHYFPHMINREFCHVYLYHYAGTLADFTLQEEEVAGMIQVSLADFAQLVTDEREEIVGCGYCIEGGQRQFYEHLPLRKERFCDHSVAYFRALIEHCQTFLRTQ